MMWVQDTVVEAARKLPAWPRFHRECGKTGLFFDHIEKESKRGAYVATAFTLRDRAPVKLGDGRGKTPIDALADAYTKCGRVVPDAEPWLRELTDGPVAVVDEFAELIGVDEFLEMLG